MYIINLTYQKSLEQVDTFLTDHIQYLEKYYASGNFICSGRKNPRSGGIIFCNATSPEQLQKIIQEDPFYQEKIASYDIVEFTPTKWNPKFENFID